MKISYWESTSVSIQSTFNLKILGFIPNINYRRVPLYPFFGFLLPDIFSEHHKTLGYQILFHSIYKINRTQEGKIIQTEFVSSFEIFKCIFTKNLIKICLYLEDTIVKKVTEHIVTKINIQIFLQRYNPVIFMFFLV